MTISLILFNLFLLGTGIFSGYHIGRMPGANFKERAVAYFRFQRPIR